MASSEEQSLEKMLKELEKRLVKKPVKGAKEEPVVKRESKSVEQAKPLKKELLKFVSVEEARLKSDRRERTAPVEKIEPVVRGPEISKKKQSPVVYEFPRITQELKSKGIVAVEKLREGAVRGMPKAGHAVPKEIIKQKIASEWEPLKLTGVDVKYPLIEPYAYSNIVWNKAEGGLKYTIIEPPLTPKEEGTLEKIRELIVDLLDINLREVKNIAEVQKYLKDKLNQIISDYEISITESEYNKILYFIYRNFLGLEKIEPIMQDPNIEDISCDGVNIPIFVFHRKYGSLKTNIMYDDPEKLNKFIIKLAQRCGKHISVADPLLDGALPDGSRLQATFSAGRDIAMRGSTFTIRKFTKDPLTIIDFMKYGTIPALIAAYLWLAIEFRNSILISGGTATGKTSALNSLCLFLYPEWKIVSIEDTPELRLPHEHWVAKIARSGYGPEESASGKRRGEISMFDLLKAALRERPDELIVGEVRGAEAYVLFQGMSTGHAGLATIHAESIDAVVNRLKTPPINLSAGLLQHLNIVLIMSFARTKGMDVRRIKEVVEIVGVDPTSGKPITNKLFRWIPAGDYFEFSSDKSYVLNKIIVEKGIPERSLWEELRRRTAILEWLKENDIRYYEDVGRIIGSYYKNPEQVLKKVFGGKKIEDASVQ